MCSWEKLPDVFKSPLPCHGIHLSPEAQIWRPNVTFWDSRRAEPAGHHSLFGDLNSLGIPDLGLPSSSPFPPCPHSCLTEYFMPGHKLSVHIPLVTPGHLWLATRQEQKGKKEDYRNQSQRGWRPNFVDSMTNFLASPRLGLGYMPWSQSRQSLPADKCRMWGQLRPQRDSSHDSGSASDSTNLYKSHTPKRNIEITP